MAAAAALTDFLSDTILLSDTAYQRQLHSLDSLIASARERRVNSLQAARSDPCAGSPAVRPGRSQAATGSFAATRAPGTGEPCVAPASLRRP